MKRMLAGKIPPDWTCQRQVVAYFALRHHRAPLIDGTLPARARPRPGTNGSIFSLQRLKGSTAGCVAEKQRNTEGFHGLIAARCRVPKGMHSALAVTSCWHRRMHLSAGLSWLACPGSPGLSLTIRKVLLSDTPHGGAESRFLRDFRPPVGVVVGRG